MLISSAERSFDEHRGRSVPAWCRTTIGQPAHEIVEPGNVVWRMLHNDEDDVRPGIGRFDTPLIVEVFDPTDEPGLFGGDIVDGLPLPK